MVRARTRARGNGLDQSKDPDQGRRQNKGNGQDQSMGQSKGQDQSKGQSNGQGGQARPPTDRRPHITVRKLWSRARNGDPQPSNVGSRMAVSVCVEGHRCTCAAGRYL